MGNYRLSLCNDRCLEFIFGETGSAIDTVLNFGRNIAEEPERKQDAKQQRKGVRENRYNFLRQMRGSMNIERIPDPRAMSRAHYMYLLDSWGAQYSGR